MLGLLSPSPAGSGFMGKPEKDSCSDLRAVRLNIRCSTLGPLLALDACECGDRHIHVKGILHVHARQV